MVQAGDRTTCKSCGAAIVFAETPKGRNMPLNAEADGTGEWVVFGDETGKLFTEKAEEGDTGLQRHTAHWVTCPGADRHRKGKR